MWGAIKDVLNGSNAILILIFACFIVGVTVFFCHKGLIKVNSKHVQIGKDSSQRELIRRQVEKSYTFIMSLYGKLSDEQRNQINGYYMKYVLERVYDKVIEWIIFNHITTNQLYVQDKQESICSLVYALGVDDKYKTPEFKKRMCEWVRELIEQLVQVKEVYQ